MSDRKGYTAASTAIRATDSNAAVRQHKAFLDARLPQLQRWVRQGVAPEALVRFALMDLATNDKLRACSPQSIYLGLLACAVTGLEPGSLRGEAYLVPFARQAVFVPGWRGLVKQARRSREIVGLVANVVRDADAFEIDLGTANSIVHRPARGDRGDVIGGYAIATLAGGHRELEYMDRDDLDKVRKVAESRGKSPAWQDWADQMARKTVIRRLCKRLPLGSDYYVAMALEQAHDDGQGQHDVLALETDAAAVGEAPAPTTEEAGDVA